MTPADSKTQRVLVLMYHRVGVAANPWEAKYCVSPMRFREHMAAMAAAGYHACGLEDFVAWMHGRVDLAPGAFLLTFDDGYEGIFEHVRPVVENLTWPATVFLVTSLIGKSDVWCRAENPAGRSYPLLTVPQIRELANAGFTFQSHTHSHADLTRLADDAIADELATARKILQSLLGASVDYLAYPYGRHNDGVVEIARSLGYTAAFSVRPGFNRRNQDIFRIRRLDIFGTDSAAVLLRKMRLGSNDGTVLGSARYYLERLGRRHSSASPDM